MKRFRGGLVSKAKRLLYHSTLGSRVIKKKKNGRTWFAGLAGGVGLVDAVVRAELAHGAVGLALLEGRRAGGSGRGVCESGPLSAVHLSRHKWPEVLVNTVE